MKIPKLTYSFFAILLLSGCIGAEQSTNKEASVMYTGEIKSLGEVSVEQKAGHILETKSGDVYYIYSDFIDLDKGKYKAVTVQISGEIVKLTESGKEIIAIESIVPLTSDVIEKDAIDETVKKYQNLLIGFRVDGLKAFDVKEYLNQVVFEKDLNSFTVTRFDNTASVPLEEWLSLSNIAETSPVLIGHDKLKAYMYLKAPNTYVYYVSRTNKYIYEVDLIFSDDESLNELKTILNSFRFVPISETKGAPQNSTGNYTAVEIEKVQSYFSANIADYVPDYGGKKYHITQYEFLNIPSEDISEGDLNYVYIVYEFDDDRGRLLLSYNFSMNKISNTKVEAVFKEGTVTDFELKDGEDKVKGLPTLVVKVGDEVSPISLMEGFRLFESTPFKFSVQYPSNWYVQGKSGKYLFNDKPLNGSYLVSMEVQKKKIEDVMADLPFTFEKSDIVPGREVFVAYPKESEISGVYLIMSRKNPDETYVLWSVDSRGDLLNKMVETITEN